MSALLRPRRYPGVHLALQRTITILGSTGSIGSQTLTVIQDLPGHYALRWLTCNTRVDDLARQVQQYNPYGVAIRDQKAWARFKQLCPEYTGRILCGEDGLCEAAADTENDVVMSAMVGFSGVVPTLAAIANGKIIALANKETLVSAGSILQQQATQYGATIVAVDSEHSAIAQCLVGEDASTVQRIILTASGGPFRNSTYEQLQSVTRQQALKHPSWDMGAKITVDSATLMNKGFEAIEARWLFNLRPDQIQVVVHPQSIVHSLVEFVDGSVKAQLGMPTMLVPIQYALTYPVRQPRTVAPLQLSSVGTLHFEEPDLLRFPCLRLAYEAMSAEGTAGCIVNAANEVAVNAFLSGTLRFTAIPEVIERTLAGMKNTLNPSLDQILQTDAEAREIAEQYCAAAL